MESYSPNSTKKLCETEAKPPRQLYRPKGCGDPPHNELHTGDRHTVAQRFISGRVRCTGDICPSIRKALQALTLQRCQASDEIGIGFRLLANEIGGVLRSGAHRPSARCPPRLRQNRCNPPRRGNPYHGSVPRCRVP